MNYKLAMVPLLLCGMLASCNDSEELIQKNPDFVEAGYGALTLTLKYPDAPKTRAVGDTLVNVAYDAEKTISSVAFFVNTETETVDGAEQYGAFGGYFSDEEVLSANGLQEELEEVTAGTPGEYTAKIRHRSDGWKNPQVIVIANYLENGLADKLKAITNWEDLGKVVSETISENPKTPLLMYSTRTIEAWKRASGGNGGGSASMDFDMDRLVSRIDIHNNAYNKTTPDNGFVLTSAQLIRPKVASYLIPGITDLPTQAVSDVPFATSGTVVEDGTAPNIIQKLDSLYTYENDNADAATATAVQVNGTFRGGKVSKVIEIKKVDGVGTIGDPIALARNHRYVVNINAAPDSTDITWDIVVKEWAESDTIKVKPVYPKPVLSDFVEVNMNGAIWTEATKTLDITNVTATGGTMTFKTIGTTASVVKLGYGFDADASSIGGKSNSIAEAGDAIVTYGSAKVETPITINIPLQNADEKVPLDVYVIVCNGGNLSACDTITIKSRPVYNGVTNALPVLMKDGKYWAPINVGATTTNNKAVTTGNITADCGKLFQWGRYIGVDATSSPSGDLSSGGNDRPVGVDGALPVMTGWDGKHILSSSSNPNTQYNWLQFVAGTDNPAATAMQKGAWYQQLWNANEGVDNADVVKVVANDPCPKGWRVPTQAEWIAIGADNSTVYTWSTSNLNLSIPGKESGKNLILPAAGNRDVSTGASYSQGAYGYYWSSSVPAASTNASYVYFNSAGKLSTNTYYRASGFSVRCVQE
ncbi:MAG: FISUMP domain-containing protein [Parabacteroides gordonii]|uniref:FISUMP domain-containing protein n=1 Tax=Parabacteroides gordonii TaxID=574930 RepID=UPI003A87BF69